MRIAIDEQYYFDEFRPSDKQTCVQHLQVREIYENLLYLPFPYTEADFDTWLGVVQRATDEQGQPVNWVIRDAEGRLIGSLGFSDFKIGQSHRAQLGYWLAKPYWGRGIMTSAVRRACQFAFEEWGLVKIAANVFARNAASARVLEKCGFEREGYLKMHYLKDGQLCDALAYGLIRPPH